uniref:Isochorismatase-like domain-containing protein n=1 Tax=Araucaria cunninghamii TaxID=56994 RepID=A0A0D6R3Q7_ARACU
MAEKDGVPSSVDWKETALLVIDMQNDFILPGGPMHVEMGASVVPAVKEAVAFAREKGALIVWVVREHDEYGRDVEHFRRHLYGEGKAKPTLKGTKGADLVEGLVIQKGDYKLEYKLQIVSGRLCLMLLHLIIPL